MLALGSTGTLYVGENIAPPVIFGGLTLSSPFTGSQGFVASLQATVKATAAPAAPIAIALFPNPAHGRATVRLPVIPGATTATLTILDALGRTLRTQTAATNTKTDLDLAGLAPGLHVVRVQAGGSTATRRLVVE